MVYIILLILFVGMHNIPWIFSRYFNQNKYHSVSQIKTCYAIYPSLIYQLYSLLRFFSPFPISFVGVSSVWPFVPSRFVAGEWWSDTVDSFAVKPKLTAPGKLYFLARVRANTCNFIFNKKRIFFTRNQIDHSHQRARKPDYFLLLREYFPRRP